MNESSQFFLEKIPWSEILRLLDRKWIRRFLSPLGMYAAYIIVIITLLVVHAVGALRFLMIVPLLVMVLSFLAGCGLIAMSPAPRPWSERNLLLSRASALLKFFKGAVMLCVGFFVSQMILEKYNSILRSGDNFSELFSYIWFQILSPSIVFGSLFVSLWLWSSIIYRSKWKKEEWRDANRKLLRIIRLDGSLLAGDWLRGMTHPMWSFFAFYMTPVFPSLLTIPGMF
ncbi:hypothetical protein [Psychromicrobium lacuslunae]|uniref:Uncharacterized protein n=1 Tax=Psychromicrobium lacuslunae TaxID=1618207 RepID=A0A0D4BZZ1_9MICC|nr:hypothetical protein [Psychromicrobium lacuslunae]AJT41666.1 hypothetical protein UM93_09360 [Psychromicrobium lacuslunae]